MRGASAVARPAAPKEARSTRTSWRVPAILDLIQPSMPGATWHSPHATSLEALRLDRGEPLSGGGCGVAVDVDDEVCGHVGVEADPAGGADLGDDGGVAADVVAVELGDPADADLLRAGGFALVLVSAVSKPLLIHLLNHLQNSFITFRLTLSQGCKM